MPAISPDAISNRVRLSNEFAADVARLISEGGTINALLSIASPLVDAVINEFPPNEKSICRVRSEDKLFTWADEQFSLSSISIPVR